MGCKPQKLMFPFEWLNRCKNRSYVGRTGCERLLLTFKTAIAKNSYEQFSKMFKTNDCTRMGD